MIVFWAVAGILSAAAAIVVMLRAAGAASRPEPVDPTPALYRRQLAEIGDLADRGLIAEAERRGAEAEAGRRLLTAAESPEIVWTAGGDRRGPLAAAAIAAPVLTLALYMTVGAPGLPDMPFAERLQQWTAANPVSLPPQALAAVLTSKIRQRPDDPEGYRFLALVDGAADDAPGAVRALKRAVKLAPERADLWELLGQALIGQAGGEVSEDAKAAFAETLKRDPTSAVARFHLARARIAEGDRAGGIAQWRTLLAELPGDDQRRVGLARAIAEAEGAPLQPSPALSGGQMTAIRGMVAGLAERLKVQPDDPAGWVRLVRAYAVLGEAAERDRALAQARARFAARADILRDLSAAAAAEPMK